MLMTLIAFIIYADKLPHKNFKETFYVIAIQILEKHFLYQFHSPLKGFFLYLSLIHRQRGFF